MQHVTLSNNCQVCGQPIPERPRGSRHGFAPKTCSEKCRKLRAAERERTRYARVKDSLSWMETRETYLRKRRQRLDSDPEFAAIFRAEAASRNREWNARLRTTDPARHAAMKAEKRAERAAWRKKLESDPTAWEAHKAACRAWYASLDDVHRDRIFNAPRRQHPGRPRVAWPASMLRLLGIVPDKEIAHKMGVHSITVAIKRRELGILALNHKRRQERAWTRESRDTVGMRFKLRGLLRHIARMERSSPEKVLSDLMDDA